MHAPRILSACLLGALASCVDLKPAPAPPVRWLSLADTASSPASELGAPVVAGLRLGAVTASSAVRDTLVRRSSEVEVAYDDYARWIEPPEDMVERALQDELYRRRGFDPSAEHWRKLDVRLVAFEETRVPRHRALVVLEIQLAEEGRILLDRRIEGDEPLEDGDPAVVAAALTAAVQEAITELSDLLAAR